MFRFFIRPEATFKGEGYLPQSSRVAFQVDFQAAPASKHLRYVAQKKGRTLLVNSNSVHMIVPKIFVFGTCTLLLMVRSFILVVSGNAKTLHIA